MGYSVKIEGAQVSVGIAQLSAVEISASVAAAQEARTGAEAAREDAIAAAGGTPWAAGSYAIGDAAVSLGDLSTYRDTVGGASAIDPSLDTGRWRRLLLPYITGLDITQLGVPNDGTLDMTAADAASTAAAGKSLHLPDGEYNFSDLPAGADSVNFTGSPFVKFTDQPLNIGTPVMTGGKQLVVASTFLRKYAASELAGSGYTDGETVELHQNYQRGTKATATIAVTSGAITGITFVSGGEDYKRGVVRVVGLSAGRDNGRA